MQNDLCMHTKIHAFGRCFVLLFVTLALAARSAEAAGIILFTANGSPYVTAVQYETFSSPTAHISYITVKGGSRTQIQSAGIIGQIPFPDAGANVSAEDAEAMISQADAYAARYPQYAKLMQGVGDLWKRKLEASKAAQSRLAPASSAPQASSATQKVVSEGPKSEIPMLKTKSGEALKNVRITRFEDDKACYTSDGTIGRLLLADIANVSALPADVKAAIEKAQSAVDAKRKAEKERTASGTQEPGSPAGSSVAALPQAAPGTSKPASETRGQDALPPATGLVVSKPQTATEDWDKLVKLLQGNDIHGSLTFALTCKTQHPQDQQMANIADALNYIAQTAAAVDSALKTERAAQPEIQRLLKNADVSDRPNPLNPSDNSSRTRAASDRNRAKEIKEGAARGVDAAKKELESAIAKAGNLAESFVKSGILDGAMAVGSTASYISTRYGVQRERSSIDEGLRSRIIDATSALEQAKTAYANKEFTRANDSLKKCLEKFPASRPALKLQDELQQAGVKIKALYAEALALKDDKQYEAAAKKLDDLANQIVDFDAGNKLKTEVAGILAKKDSSLATARLKEQSGDVDAALAIFDQYDCTDDIKRVAAKLAENSEKEGNYLTAMKLFEKAGLAERAADVRQKAKEQDGEYVRAEVLLAEHKLDEALAIYDKYKDKNTAFSALKKIAVLAENNAEFETALELYRRANAAEDVERTNELLKQQKVIASQAAKKEASGDYDAAAQLFEEAGATKDLRRVCLLYAKALESKGEYSTAAEYYERGEQPNEAKRIRETFSAQIESSPSRSHALAPEEIYKRNIDAVVTVIVSGPDGSGHGSGFFVKKGGWVVTNNHVTDDAAVIKVRLNDKKEYPAKLVKSQKVPDFALLKVDLPLHKVVQLGSVAKLHPGQNVYAVGTPVDLDMAGTITGGMISNMNKMFLDNPCIAITAAINHGNSGGPLFSDDGKVIGVNTFGMGTAAVVHGVSIGSDIQNMNFAIQIDEIRPLIEKFAK